jgi:hypothetical protein
VRECSREPGRLQSFGAEKAWSQQRFQKHTGKSSGRKEGLKWVSMDLRKHPQHKIAW